MNWQAILIIELSIFYVSTVPVQERTYYIISNDLPKIECPVESCQNLTSLLDDIVPENISNATIYLLPGIHQISTETRNIISITAASNLSISSFSMRATIRCKGHVAFEFHSCVNLTIKDITVEKCGAPRHFDYRKIPGSNFSVYISHSLGVYIINIHILNGTGIGLLLENVQSELLILDTTISHNAYNLFLINYNNYTSNTTVSSSIMVCNSSFNYASSHLSQQLDSGGIYVYIYSNKFQTELVLMNVNLFKNERNLYFHFTLCNKWTLVKIYNLTSINHQEKLNLQFKLEYSRKCNLKEKQTNFIFDSAEIVGGEMHIYSAGRIGHRVTNNIIIHNINISKCLFFITRVIRVQFKNIAIQNTDIFKSMQIEISVIVFGGYFLYQRNIGSQMTFKKSEIIMDNNSTFLFRHNSHLPESSLYCTESHITMMSGSSMSFSNNAGHESGGITLMSSNITFEGNSSMTFVRNTGKRGGAMAFYALSKLMPIEGQTNLTFEHNYATIVGGAIYVQDYDYTSRRVSQKFLLEPKPGIKPPNFKFVNNSATQAGDVLYGGAGNKKDFIRFFDNTHKDRLSVGSTNPFKVCMCINSIPNCRIKDKRFHPIPGQQFKIEVVAVGQWNGVVPANIQINFNETSKAKIKANEYIQSVGRNCTSLTYSFTFTKQYETMDLQVITTNQNPAKEVNLKILLRFRNCSLGFSFTSVDSTCICNNVLTEHGIECDIETLTVKRPSQKWISATFEHLLPLEQSGIIVHDHCPYDYCIKSINGAVQSLNLEYPDKQCAFYHSGILCGGCQTNLSQVLGTNKCKMCTNSKLSLILFFSALTGLSLVICLLLLNITVTAGTINGLIFYTNIVQAADAFFFPQVESKYIFSVFIAWLNLDLGIETCFYDGLNAYAKTWLQFLFPLYIWLIVIAIIVISHYSMKVSNFIGNNSVHVLATLFLLSYAKLLRIIITIFSSTQLTYPDGYVRMVWLYDGNVDFLKGKHIPLFITALMFLVLVSVPLTAILTFIQCLQKISHYRLLAWVTKLQPLFDAYTGPYKIKHRYWTGLLLLTRVCLFLVFSLNIFGDPIINLLAIVATVFSLVTYLSIIGGVYKSWWLNVIESVFIMNLGLLSAAGLYKVAADVSIAPITNTSTSIAFILFMAIVLYHIIIKVSETKYGKVTIANIKKFVNNRWQRETELTSVNENITENGLESIATHSEVELREPLLATND